MGLNSFRIPNVSAENLWGRRIYFAQTAARNRGLSPMQSDFYIQEIWNKSFDLKNYGVKPRNYLRASEIGKPFLDVYLACKGIEPSNPYDERVMRKFEAGRLFEWLIGNVFRKSGLEVKSNESIPPIEIPDCLRVYGHYDFLVSGGANWKEAEERVKAEKFPSGIESVCLNLVDRK